MAWQSRIPECPVFRPSEDEFRDPLAYIQSIRPQAERAGICKITPPPGMMESLMAPATVLHKQHKFRFTTRVQMLRVPKWGCNKQQKHHFLKSGRTYSLPEFERAAASFAGRMLGAGATLPAAAAEAHFWRELEAGQLEVEYGSDLEGTAFSAQPADALAGSSWNLRVLPRLEGSILRQISSTIPGVTDPMLYIGMLYSMFAWHVEDHFLYSINYHHMGAPKVWYGVPGDAALSFEAAALRKLSTTTLARKEGLAGAQRSLLGKTSMFPPSLLLDAGVPTFRAVQSAGEFVITFPRAYHGGFSTGFNCGEAVNFGTADWIPFSTAAERRYAILRHSPLLCHEEVLVKEAQRLWGRFHASAPQEGAPRCQAAGPPGLPLTVRQRPAPGAEDAEAVMREFVQLLRLHDRATWWLVHKRGARRTTLPQLSGPMPCSLCLRLCYLSVITCACQPEPICLHHASVHKQCRCGARRELAQRHDIGTLVGLAKKMDRALALHPHPGGPGAVVDIEAYAPAMLHELQGCWEAGSEGYSWLDPGPDVPPAVAPSGVSRPARSSSGSPPSVGSPLQGGRNAWPAPRARSACDEGQATAHSGAGSAAALPGVGWRKTSASDGLPVLLPLHPHSGPRGGPQAGAHPGPEGREGQPGGLDRGRVSSPPTPASPPPVPGQREGREQREDGVALASLRALVPPGLASGMRMLLHMQSLGIRIPSARSHPALSHDAANHAGHTAEATTLAGQHPAEATVGGGQHTAEATTLAGQHPAEATVGGGQHTGEAAASVPESQGPRPEGERGPFKAQCRPPCMATVLQAPAAPQRRDTQEEQFGAGKGAPGAAEADTVAAEQPQAMPAAGRIEGITPAAEVWQPREADGAQRPEGAQKEAQESGAQKDAQDCGPQKDAQDCGAQKDAQDCGTQKDPQECVAAAGGRLATAEAAALNIGPASARGAALEAGPASCLGVQEGHPEPPHRVAGRGRGRRTRRQLSATLLGLREASQAAVAAEASEAGQGQGAAEVGQGQGAAEVGQGQGEVDIGEGWAAAIPEGPAAEDLPERTETHTVGSPAAEELAERTETQPSPAGGKGEAESTSGAMTQTNEEGNDVATQGHLVPSGLVAATPMAGASGPAEDAAETGCPPEVPGCVVGLPASERWAEATTSPCSALVLPPAPGAAGASHPAPALGLDLNVAAEDADRSPPSAGSQAAAPRGILTGVPPGLSLAPRVLGAGGPALDPATGGARESLGAAGSNGHGIGPQLLQIPRPVHAPQLLHVPPMLLDAMARGRRLKGGPAEAGPRLPQSGPEGPREPPCMGLAGSQVAGVQGSQVGGTQPTCAARVLPRALPNPEPSSGVHAGSGAWHATEGHPGLLASTEGSSPSLGLLQRSPVGSPVVSSTPALRSGPLSTNEPQAWQVAGEGARELVWSPAQGSTPLASSQRPAGTRSLDAVLALPVPPPSGCGLDLPEQLTPQHGSPSPHPPQGSILGTGKLLPDTGGGLALAALPGALCRRFDMEDCAPGAQHRNSGGTLVACLALPAAVTKRRTPRGSHTVSSEDTPGARLQGRSEDTPAARLQGSSEDTPAAMPQGGSEATPAAMPQGGSEDSPAARPQGSSEGTLPSRLQEVCRRVLGQGQEEEGGATPPLSGLLQASVLTARLREGPVAQSAWDSAVDVHAQDQGTAGRDDQSHPRASDQVSAGPLLRKPVLERSLALESAPLCAEGSFKLEPPSACVKVALGISEGAAAASEGGQGGMGGWQLAMPLPGTAHRRGHAASPACIPWLQTEGTALHTMAGAGVGDGEGGGDGEADKAEDEECTDDTSAGDANGAACMGPSSHGAAVSDGLQASSPSSRPVPACTHVQGRASRTRSVSRAAWSSVPKRRRTNRGRAAESCALAAAASLEDVEAVQLRVGASQGVEGSQGGGG